jgi:hypothetical protein
LASSGPFSFAPLASRRLLYNAVPISDVHNSISCENELENELDYEKKDDPNGS